MSTQNPVIDIYADKPTVTLAYKIAVMQKALELGENTVQSHDGYHSGCFKWENSIQRNRDHMFPARLVWNWYDWTYRIDPACKPFVMPGYNPDELDQYAVGLTDGWRLLHVEEIACLHGRPIDQSRFEYLRLYDKKWYSCATNEGCAVRRGDGYPYRTKLTKEAVLAHAAGHQLA